MSVQAQSRVVVLDTLTESARVEQCGRDILLHAGDDSGIARVSVDLPVTTVRLPEQLQRLSRRSRSSRLLASQQQVARGSVQTSRPRVVVGQRTIEVMEPIGSRRLAYRIGQNSDGFYVLFHLQGEGDFTKQVERRLKVADPVMKFLTVRIDLELKKIEKLKKLREKREARKKAKARPAPAAEAV